MLYIFSNNSFVPVRICMIMKPHQAIQEIYIVTLLSFSPSRIKE